MRNSLSALLGAYCAILACLRNARCDTHRGLLVTSTNQWVSGSSNKICMTSYHISSAISVTIVVHDVDAVSSPFNNGPDERQFKVYNSTEVIIPAGVDSSTCTSLTITVNSAETTSVQLSVRARNHDDDTASSSEQYRFERNATIEVRQEHVTTFIETDKSVYKPSDTVRFRILSVRGPEAKLVTDKVSLVTVEDPSGTRVMQWTDVENSNGLVQLELPLSNEPPFGEWSVKTRVNNQQQTATFTVKEYVLPKFEVSISHPSFIHYQQNATTWRVCAKYTYGEPVPGEVESTSICSRRIYDTPGTSRQCVNLNLNTARLSDGCVEFSTESCRDILPTDRWMAGSMQVNITARIKERGTGVVLSGTQLINVVADAVLIELSQNNRPFFKPGFAYHGTGSLLKPDRTPYDRSRSVVFVADQLINETITTDAQGRFDFTIPADVLRASRNKSIDIQVSLEKASNYGPIGYLTLKPWYSPSSSFMKIDSPDGAVQLCRSVLSIPVTYVTDDVSTSGPLSFTYQIMSRGAIVTSGISAAAVNSATDSNGPIRVDFVIDVNVTPMMSGTFDVIVFHIRSDGETVADTSHISVEQCFEHQVSMNFAEAKVQPGHATSVRIAADVTSLCAVGVVDKSVELMGKSTALTADKVDATRETYHTSRRYNDYFSSRCEPPQNDTDPEDDVELQHDASHVQARDSNRRRMIAPAWGNHYYSNFLDTAVAFHFAGAIVLTDLVIHTRPCSRLRLMPYYARSRTYSSGLGSAPRVMKLNAAVDSPPVMGPVEMMFDSAKSQSPAPEVLHRTYFPETWLWQLNHLGNSNQHEMPVTLPHTITEWIGNGYCVNPTSGLGVSKPFKITAFQPFFMSFTLPYSLVRGESVIIPVTVFNYMADQCLQVTLTVENSTSFELRKTNPRSALSADIGQLKVCSRQSETHSFRLVARQLGSINFTVTGSSELFPEELTNVINNMEQASASDAVTQQLLVISEGKEEEQVRSVYTCALPENSNQSSGSWSLTLPDDVISDSVRTSVNVIGDVMGSALSDLDKLLTLPTGCGEQNMLKFAPNIYVLEYLSRTDQLTDEIKAKAVGFLQTGYQRELTYRHTDGSYSAFGNHDPEGSIWLTAFVVRSFARARPFIFIDDNDLDTSIRWIQGQQMANGCFRSVGKVLHKAMTGGLQHDESNLSLTAYIVISLLEANTSSSDASVTNAIRCINGQSINDTYAASLLAYAYSLYAGDVSGKRDVTDFIQSNAVQTGGMKYWRSNQRGESDQYMTSSSSAADIELTSYILLSSLSNPTDGEIHDVVATVRWLSTQRNAYGGFTSTQDTILALQALSAFATRVYRSGSDLDLIVSLAGQGHGNLRCQGRKQCQRHQFVVNNSNRLVRQQSSDGGFKLPTTVEWNVSGTGCALVQVAVKYNRAVTSPDQQSREAFVLNVTVEQPNTCKTMRLVICASYNGEDSASNMAVVAIKMMSGWAPDKYSIKKLKSDANDVNFGINYIKRVEVDEKNVVNVYFDEFDKSQRCFVLDVLQEMIVYNAKPGLVHIYDYYAPGSSVFASYEMTSRCTSSPRRPSSSAAAAAAAGGDSLNADSEP